MAAIRAHTARTKMYDEMSLPIEPQLATTSVMTWCGGDFSGGTPAASWIDAACGQHSWQTGSLNSLHAVAQRPGHNATNQHFCISLRQLSLPAAWVDW